MIMVDIAESIPSYAENLYKQEINENESTNLRKRRLSIIVHCLLRDPQCLQNNVGDDVGDLGPGLALNSLKGRRRLHLGLTSDSFVGMAEEGRQLLAEELLQFLTEDGALFGKGDLLATLQNKHAGPGDTQRWGKTAVGNRNRASDFGKARFSIRRLDDGTDNLGRGIEKVVADDTATGNSGRVSKDSFDIARVQRLARAHLE